MVSNFCGLFRMSEILKVSHFMYTMLGYVEIQSCFVTLNQENILLELYFYLGKYSKLLMKVDKNMRRGFFETI